MGYEKGITRKWSDMVLNGVYLPVIPGGPRSPDSPSGGTPNHELLARMARLTWALERGTAEQQSEELEGVVRFYDNQVEGGFMTRGNANEQFSPSHSQWWITAALGLRWLGWKLRETQPDVSAKLLAVTGRWLRHHHALCRLFATKGGIVAPGARAWPQPTPESGKVYSGKCKARDELCQAIESGKVRKVWDPDNLDMLGLVFADRLLKAGDDLGGAWEGTEPRILGEKASGGIDRIGGESSTGLPALIAGLRDVADRRKAVRAELRELIAKLEAPGADLEDIGAALRDLAERRPAARAELLDFADRLERFRVGPVVA